MLAKVTEGFLIVKGQDSFKDSYHKTSHLLSSLSLPVVPHRGHLLVDHAGAVLGEIPGTGARGLRQSVSTLQELKV